jgi:hypothetical protein
MPPSTAAKVLTPMARGTGSLNLAHSVVITGAVHSIDRPSWSIQWAIARHKKALPA